MLPPRPVCQYHKNKFGFQKQNSRTLKVGKVVGIDNTPNSRTLKVGKVVGIDNTPTNFLNMADMLSGVKPVIQPIKVVPFKEKSSFHFVVL